jgi:TRAP-type C4-dicarboxylate transport system substrate-binding protein
VCKYIIEPRIFQMNIEALVNLKKWESLPADVKKQLTEGMINCENNYSKIMAELGEKELKQMQAKGMKYIKFSPQDTKWYVDLAYKAQWDDVIKQAPKLGPKLKKMLTP